MDELAEAVQEEIRDIVPAFDPAPFETLHLTPQQILFCYHYVETGDQVQAYKDAYGANHKTALTRGKVLLNDAKIKQGLQVLYDLIWEEAQSKLPLKLLQNLNAVQDLDVADYYTEFGDAKPLSQIPEAKRKLINNVEIIVNPKTGMPITRYDLPNKSKTASIMMEIMKIKKEAKGDDNNSNTEREAAEMRAKIFGS